MASAKHARGLANPWAIARRSTCPGPVPRASRATDNISGMRRPRRHKPHKARHLEFDSLRRPAAGGSQRAARHSSPISRPAGPRTGMAAKMAAAPALPPSGTCLPSTTAAGTGKFTHPSPIASRGWEKHARTERAPVAAPTACMVRQNASQQQCKSRMTSILHSLSHTHTAELHWWGFTITRLHSGAFASVGKTHAKTL